MKTTVRFLAVVLVLGLCISPLLAQKKSKPGKSSLFSAQVKKVLPGIDAIISLNAEQKEKHIKLRKEMVASAEYVNAQKSIKNKDASKEDRASARNAITKVQETQQTRLNEIIGTENAALIAKINGIAADIQRDVRAQFRQKIKDAKNDKAARTVLAKEMQGKTASAISEKVLVFLNDAQREALKNASSNKKNKKGKRSQKGKGKKDKENKEDADKS